MTRRVTLQYARAKTTRRSLFPPQTMHRPDAAIARKLAPPGRHVEHHVYYLGFFGID